MPELPEVETVARQLAECIGGRTITGVTIRDSLLTPDRPERMVGRQILRVSRSGKQVRVDLGQPGATEPDLLVLIHLRMTGRLLAASEPPNGDGRHVRAVVDLDRGFLHYIDPRRFGTIRVMTPDRFEPGPGVEPLERTFSVHTLARLAAGGRQQVKPWLMRQDRLVGIGNIYASEILYAAGLSPFAVVGELTGDQLHALHREIRRVLRRAIRWCGTTFSDFQDANGQSGRFARMLCVYGRDGQPCRACGRPIEKSVQQGRSTFYCPACQS